MAFHDPVSLPHTLLLSFSLSLTLSPSLFLPISLSPLSSPSSSLCLFTFLIDSVAVFVNGLSCLERGQRR